MIKEKCTAEEANCKTRNKRLALLSILFVLLLLSSFFEAKK